MSGIEPTPIAALKSAAAAVWGLLTTLVSLGAASLGGVLAMAGPIAVPDDDDNADDDAEATDDFEGTSFEEIEDDGETLSASFDEESVRAEAESPDHGTVQSAEEATDADATAPRETPVEAVIDGVEAAEERLRGLWSGDAAESAGRRADEAAASAAERASEFSLIGAARYVIAWPGQWFEVVATTALLLVSLVGVVPAWAALYVSLVPASIGITRYTNRRLKALDATANDGDAVDRIGPVDRVLDSALATVVLAVHAVPFGERITGGVRRDLRRVGLAVTRQRRRFAAWWSSWRFWSTLGSLSVAALTGGVLLGGRAMPGKRSSRASNWVATEIGRRMTDTFHFLGQRRRRFATWRGQRPFWGGAIMCVGALVVGWVPAHLAMMIAIIPGSIAFVGLIFAALMALCGTFSVLKPQLSGFLGWFGMVLSVLSIMGGALGGFFIGTIVGVTGGAMLVAWEEPDDEGVSTTTTTESNATIAAGD